MRRPIAAVFALTSTVFYFIACGSDTPTAPSAAKLPASSVALNALAVSGHGAHSASTASHTTAALSADVHQQIAEVRAFLAPFHNFKKAEEYGYSVPAPAPGVCISDPARGGMGYHYTNAKKDLITDGVVNLLEHEFIVYSPQPNGEVRLSAADYFVPYSTWPHPEPPSLLGIPFAREDAFQAWVLHIWAFWPNPAGIFANFNPDVPLCPT
jgi:hypothetical protein